MYNHERQQRHQPQMLQHRSHQSNVCSPLFVLRWFGGSASAADDDDNDEDQINGSTTFADSGAMTAKTTTANNNTTQETTNESGEIIPKAATGTKNKKSSATSRITRDLGDLVGTLSNLRTSQRIGDRAESILDDLDHTLVVGTSPDGKNVKVTMNGYQNPISVQIEPSFVQALCQRSNNNNNNQGSSSSSSGKSSSNAVEELCTAITLAMQDAYHKASAKADEHTGYLFDDL